MRPTVTLLLVASLLAGCTTDDQSSAGDPLGEVLCRAADAPTATAARSAFAEAHDGLHTLARDLQATDDRAAAARVLEAKQQVEAAVQGDDSLDVLGPRLDDLLTAVADATSEPNRPPCT